MSLHFSFDAILKGNSRLSLPLLNGFQFTLANCSVLPSLFKEQAENSYAIANELVQSVIVRMHGFTYDLLTFVCKDADVIQRLWRKIRGDLLSAYSDVLSLTEKLAKMELEGHLVTQNHYYADNLRKARAARIERNMSERMKHLDSWSFGSNDSEPVTRLVTPLMPMSAMRTIPWTTCMMPCSHITRSRE